MKYRESEEITTFHIAKDLKVGDYFTILLPNRHLLILKYSIGSRSLQLILSNEGDRIDKEPFLEITDAQMEDLDASPTKGTYHSITVPDEYFAEVQKRLKGLPVL